MTSNDDQPMRLNSSGAEADDPEPDRTSTQTTGESHPLPELEFDFAQHRARSIEDYRGRVEAYRDYANAVYAILKAGLDDGAIKVHSIQSRAKDIESFGDKARRPSDEDPNLPRYPDPLRDITDLAGVRVITYFLSTEEQVDALITGQFDVVERTDRSAILIEEDKLGYSSIHFLVRLKRDRLALPEYRRFDGLIAEIQLRTILQHAWAEIEHDIRYKATVALPKEISRRFVTLAGLLEIGDREFQSIQDSSESLREAARVSVAAGQLEGVEITPESLKSYLDKEFGPDGRMADWSYSYTARLLMGFGFSDLAQVDAAVSLYDDDQVSRVINGSRQGQLSRFEDLLLAALGEEFVTRHPFHHAGSEWFTEWKGRALNRLREAQIPVGTYRPPSTPEALQT